MKVLMVEDETHLAEAVQQILKVNNYSVDLAFDGEHGLDCAMSGIYDIIVLDIMLPKMDGITILKELRSSGVTTPVILLTAKGEVENKVEGLDSGADDYLAKPFHTEELIARLRALVRRKGEFHHDNILCFKDIEFNPFTLELRCREKIYKLTLKEGQLLELLLNHKTMILPTSMIIERLWGFDSDTEDSHVQVYISFLRKKLSQLGSNVTIRSVRGVGYILAVHKEVEKNV
ncbi:MAG: response regulator transcription factor [Firmicutes bacterium]|nr:response regulator transcription factor [Bacillota bacterium]